MNLRTFAPCLALPLLGPLTCCQPLRLPPRSDFRSIAVGETGLPDVYSFVRRAHNSTFPNDPFERFAAIAIDRRQAPAPQQSEAAVETWTVESVHHRRYAYTLRVGITREAGVETVIDVEVLAIHAPLPPGSPGPGR